MKMKQVLAEKINRKHQAIYAIDFTATVQEAAKMMHEEKIGAMLVNMPTLEDGVYAGILSERDIISSCANCRGFDGTLAISKIMSKELIKADVEDHVNKIVRCMREKHIRHIPLSEKGKIIALLSIRDLMYCVDMQKETTLAHMSDMLGSCRRNKNY